MPEGAPPSRLLDRWTRTVIRLRWAVVAGWVAAVVVGAVLAGQLGTLFESQTSVPGTEAQRVDDVLKADFGQRSYAGWTVVVRSRSGDVDPLLPVLEERAARAAEGVPTGKLFHVQKISDRVATAEIASSLDVPKAHEETAGIRDALGTVPGADLWVTGNAAIQADTLPVFEHDLIVGEVFIALPAALLILAFVFGTAALLVPLLFAFAAIPATLGLVWVFAHWLKMEQTVQNLVTFIGLGIAIDYSLLIVYRYREELRKAASKQEAVLRTMQTAGRAVVFSGTAVAIGLALLIAMPVPGLRGYGVAGLLVPVVSVVCALTLLPVMLFSLEGKLDRVRLVPRRILERRESLSEENAWMRFAHRIMRRPGLYAAASLALLVLAALPVFALELGPGTAEQLPARLESTQGLRVLAAEVGDGALDPVEIVVDSGGSGRAGSGSVQLALANLTTRLNNDPAIGRVDAPLVDADGRYIRLQAISRFDYGAPESREMVGRLRDDVVGTMSWPVGVEASVGGTAAWGADFLDRTYDAFPWLVVVVLLLTYVLLLRAFRSLLLPLKAIVLNVLSVAAAYGLLVATFKFGLGEPLGLIGYDQITGWIPVFLFAMLFGLSMDYEVFLVSRMREEWDRTHDNAQAVAMGLAKTGRLVTAAGLIMFAAFMGFVVGSFVELQQFGFGLAVAILIDVTIVRALLLPSAMALFGRWNWWLPAPIARAVRVEPSPLQAPSGGPAAAPM